jgi:hypothetical protein
MKLKNNTPCTAAQRHLTQLNYGGLSKKPLLKNNIKGLKKKFKWPE